MSRLTSARSLFSGHGSSTATSRRMFSAATGSSESRCSSDMSPGFDRWDRLYAAQNIAALGSTRWRSYENRPP